MHQLPHVPIQQGWTRAEIEEKKPTVKSTLQASVAWLNEIIPVNISLLVCTAFSLVHIASLGSPKTLFFNENILWLAAE